MGGETLRHRDIAPTYPGDLLADVVIPATGKTKVEIAQLLGVSRQTLYEILGRRQSVTPVSRSARQVIRQWCRACGFVCSTLTTFGTLNGSLRANLRK